jgi:hypothetical protein
MVQLYFRDEPGVWRAPRDATRPDDQPFIAAANVAAGWVYEIAGPFFWGALILLLGRGGAAPR